MEKKLEKAYSENQQPEFNSGEEINAWFDYKQARDSGAGHEAAMKRVAEQAAKIDKIYRIRHVGR